MEFTSTVPLQFKSREIHPKEGAWYGGCPSPGGVQGQAGWGPGQPGLAGQAGWGPGQPGLALDMEVGSPACNRGVEAS